MTPTLLLFAVLVPALFYAALLYAFDVHEREPLWALAMLFAAGALCVPVAGMVEHLIDQLVPFVSAMRRGELAAVRFGCFFGIAPVEELIKLTAVAVLARRSLMNEPVDGVVYAGVTALGFAACEGVLAATHAHPGTVLMRGVLSTPGHLCFSALWGAGLGAVRYWGPGALPAAGASFFASWVAHGTYDYVLIADHGSARGAVVAVLSAAGVVTAVLFRALLGASPFRGVAPRKGRCAACRHPYPAQARFCARCGMRLVVWVAPPLPLGFAATLLGFASQGLVLVSGSVLLARLHEESTGELWSFALRTPSLRTLLGALVVAGGALTAGLCARAHRGRFARLEALLATSLVVLAALLFLALTDPTSLIPALWLVPLALAVSAVAAGRAGESTQRD
jgi:RsiW-degrading membrane proteinase PrsW (M82 family)